MTNTKENELKTLAEIASIIGNHTHVKAEALAVLIRGLMQKSWFNDTAKNVSDLLESAYQTAVHAARLLDAAKREAEAVLADAEATAEAVEAVKNNS